MHYGARMTASRWQIAAALCVVYVAWGATYPAIRVMVETVPPLLGTAGRFLLAGAALLAFVLARRGRAAARADARELAGAAIVGAVILGDIGLVALAEEEVPAGIAALIIASVPMWIVLLRLGHRERVPPGTLAAVVAGFCGLALIVLPGERAGAGPVLWLLILMVAGAVEALGQYYGRRAPLPADGLFTTAIQLLAAAFTLFAFGVAAGELSGLRLDSVSARSMAGFAYLVVPGSIVAYSAFVWLLANAPISTVATYAYVNPVVAIIIGWLLLGEDLTPPSVAAAAVIVTSVAVIARSE